MFYLSLKMVKQSTKLINKVYKKTRFKPRFFSRVQVDYDDNHKQSR